MFLKSLTIESCKDGAETEVIREIYFRMGVNLIVDESSDLLDSGNNIGKTTVLRLVDYCLGGKGKNIYTDSEFENQHRVKEFLEEEEVLITLVLVKNAAHLGRTENSAAREIKIERNFLSRSQKIQRINGESYTIEDFPLKLARLIFQHTEAKPTLRQLVSKNIRDENEKLSNIVRVLSNFVSDLEYEALYQFWFGITNDQSNAHQKARKQFQKQDAYKKKLAKDLSLNTLAVIPSLEAEIEALAKRKAEYDLDPEYQEQIRAFDGVRSRLTQLGNELSAVLLRQNLIHESKSSLEKDLSKVAENEVSALYAEAQALIPDLEKSFKDSISFHNTMIKNRLDFITKELPELQQREEKLRMMLSEAEHEAENYKSLLNEKNTQASLDEINTALLKLQERHARLTEQKEIWEHANQEFDELKNKLASFDDLATDLNQQIIDHLIKFNRYFGKISTALYGEQFALTKKEYDHNGKEVKTLKFSMQGVTENPGTGEKKGHITAFDLAYIPFAEELGIPHLNFIMHDQIENISGVQIEKILLHEVPKINCQYIAPILQDKLPENIDESEYVILRLSQNNKLFKLP